jgi:outer membrane protein assembly factor BamA
VAAVGGRPRSPGPLPGRIHRRPALTRRVLVLASLLCLGLAGPARASFSIIPLPAIDTDPNAGATYGVLPVLLIRDEAEQVRRIIAPSLTYNEFRGITGTFRYFDYPTPAERFEFIAGYSETIERELDIRYRNLGLFAGRFHADVQILYERDSTIRFFGLGPASRRVDETNMTLGVAGLYMLFGLNVTPNTRLSLGETVQNFDVRRGSVPGLPFTGTVFPDLAGVDGTFVHAQRAVLAYDDRDSFTTPSRGLLVRVYLEASTELLGSESEYVKAGAEAVYLKPAWDGRVVLVARGLIEGISGGNATPFEVKPTLGGATTLRGFSQNRFYGDARVLANAEARVKVFRMRIFGMTAEFEAAPFLDMGKVFTNTDELIGSQFEVTPGIALRGLAPPSVVGRVEIGVSREGPAIFVGLDYPF